MPDFGSTILTPELDPTPRPNLKFSSAEKRLILEVAKRLAQRILNAQESRKLSVSPLWKPKTDIFEPLFSGIIVAQLELPGVRAEDCRINVVNGFLVIEGERRVRYQCCDLSSGKWKNKPRDANDCDFVGVRQPLNEMRYGSWQKKFKVPDGVGPEHIKTRLENGILHVQWPGSFPEI